jgi:hypothetical protein
LNNEDETHRALEWLIERTRVIDCVVRFANAFDRKDWDALRSCLADRVETDYSAFRGTLPSVESAETYVESRRRALGNLHTLHVSTNHVVEIAEGRATCWSAYQIYRVDPNLQSGENRLDTAGNYEHELVWASDGWRIQGIRQSVVVFEGNQEIHSGLRKRLESPEGPTT